MRAAALVLVALAGRAWGAHPDLRWYSEFRRVGPDGRVLAQDSEGSPREVLSPAAPRNGYSTFRLVVRAPAGRAYYLHFGANPETIVQHKVYREGPEPDRLTEVALPAGGSMAEGRADAYLVDIFVPAHSGVRRVRVEAQLNVGDDWIIAPLELRLQQASIPAVAKGAGSMAAVEANVADTAYSVLRGFVCGRTEPFRHGAPGVREFVRRNAVQDIALAAALEARPSGRQVRATLAAAISAEEPARMCAQPAGAAGPYDPEAYLKVRQYLYRLAGE
jgi:hypothetical protein